MEWVMADMYEVVVQEQGYKLFTFDKQEQAIAFAMAVQCAMGVRRVEIYHINGETQTSTQVYCGVV